MPTPPRRLLATAAAVAAAACHGFPEVRLALVRPRSRAAAASLAPTSTAVSYSGHGGPSAGRGGGVGAPVEDERGEEKAAAAAATWGDLLSGGGIIPVSALQLGKTAPAVPVEVEVKAAAPPSSLLEEEEEEEEEEEALPRSQSRTHSQQQQPQRKPRWRAGRRLGRRQRDHDLASLQRHTEEVLEGRSALVSSGERKRDRTYAWLFREWTTGPHSDRPEAADRASGILLRMEADLPPSHPLLGARTYTKAVSARARAGGHNAGRRAEGILRRMGAGSAGVAEVARPNAYTYNAVINAWANSGDFPLASERAEQLLAEMERSADPRVRPTIVTWNAVLDCLAKAGGRQGAERAEELLRQLESRYEEAAAAGREPGGVPRPNARSFNTVMNAWAKSGTEEAASKAVNILDLMERLSTLIGDDASGDGTGAVSWSGGRGARNPGVRPDVVSFSTAINAWARSPHRDKAEQVLGLLRRMARPHKAADGGEEEAAAALRPNVVIYNSVLNACAYSVGDTAAEQNRAVEVAHDILKRMEREAEEDPSGGVIPDQVTYGTFLKVCANQMTDTEARAKVVSVIFRKAARSGQVGTMVLQQLQALTGPEGFRQLVGAEVWDIVDVSDLPKEWSRNVVEGKRKRRRHLH